MQVHIVAVATKRFDKIEDWEASNPNWNLTDAGTQSYIEMVKEVTAGGDDDDDRSNNRIIKAVAKEVIIEK